MRLTAELLRTLIAYDPATGSFTWIARPNGRVPPGSSAGAWHPNGYLYIKVRGLNCVAHRLAWLYVHGEWPRQFIDHINGCRSDNRIANLRDVSRGANMRNPNNRIYSSSTTGVKGVHWHKASGKYAATISVNGCRRHLGCFSLLSEAAAARADAVKASGAFV